MCVLCLWASESPDKLARTVCCYSFLCYSFVCIGSVSVCLLFCLAVGSLNLLLYILSQLESVCADEELFTCINLAYEVSWLRLLFLCKCRLAAAAGCCAVGVLPPRQGSSYSRSTVYSGVLQHVLGTYQGRLHTDMSVIDCQSSLKADPEPARGV